MISAEFPNGSRGTLEFVQVGSSSIILLCLVVACYLRAIELLDC